MKILLTGDVMLGRGIDQILPVPGDPALKEDYVASARDYVALAEAAHGPIPRHAGFDYVWGDAIDSVAQQGCDLRIVNLETAITASGTPVLKGINYRVNPANAGVLKSFSIDACALANNHVLDWGAAGLTETLSTLEAQGISAAGAGADDRAARAPAVLDRGAAQRVLLLSAALQTSGVPADWAATAEKPGVFLLQDMSERTVRMLKEAIAAARRPGDLVVLSLHWGSNWGYDIAEDEIAFARALVDTAGVDILHGHSSHHPRPLEVRNGRLILYGCGDFLNDYEGISGYEEFRGDLVLGYVATLGARNRLAALDLLAFRIRRFRLERASPADTEWLRATLARTSHRFGATFTSVAGNTFSLAIPSAGADPDLADMPP